MRSATGVALVGHGNEGVARANDDRPRRVHPPPSLTAAAAIRSSRLSCSGASQEAATGRPAATPSLLTPDEPTNHLDFGSVEAGLRACDGAPFVVSHDERLLAAAG